MPPIDGMAWLPLLQQSAASNTDSKVIFPQRITFHTPLLTLGGQHWNNLRLVSQEENSDLRITARAQEMNAELTIRQHAPGWR